MPEVEIKLSPTVGYHRRGRPGALNDLLRTASELIIPAVHASLVDFAVASDRSATYSYTTGTAKLDTYETTIVQQWARYMASHGAFADYGIAWESKFKTGQQGRPPAVDIVIEDSHSKASKRVALIEVKVSEGALDANALWSDAKKLWLLECADNGSIVEVQGKRVVVNIVSNLPTDTTLSQFQTSVEQLRDASESWEPQLRPVFSAVFPVFRPSPGDGSTPMWIVHGAAGFELH